MGNVPGMWDPHATNDRGCQMDYLGHPHREWPDKMVQKMGPNERKFYERRKKKLEDIKKKEHEEAHLKSQGWYKKAQVVANAGEHSSLKRTKPPWNDQIVSNHVYFSEYEKSKPGDHQYLTGLRPYVEQPERAMSYERDFILGDPQRTTYWKPPPAGKVTGTCHKHNLARELLCPSGCPTLSPSASAANSPMGKATGSTPKGGFTSMFSNVATAARGGSGK